MSKLELRITNNSGYSTVVDVVDYPFRLNKTVFTTSQDKLKTLGGVTSTNIKLSKSKRNNRLFVGKGEFSDYSKFNNQVEYKGVITENGDEIARGTFSFDEGSISWEYYEGTFYDENIDWVGKLANTQLNRLDYIDGKPTWLVPFNGAITFNVINDLSNEDTDFICPTLVYNNTPIADYLDLTDEEIWGVFDLSDPQNPKRITPAFSINDFVCESGYFGTRLGHTFDSFPPAVNYKNLITRIFNSIGVSFDCTLFNEEWFNAIYLPFVGSQYKYNWKNLAEVSTNHPVTIQNGLSLSDELLVLENYSIPSLPLLSNDPDALDNWFAPNYTIKYRKTHLLDKEDFSSPLYKDLINAVNPFGIERQYIVPTSGIYKFKISSTFESRRNNFEEEYYGSASTLGFDGQVLFENVAVEDPLSGRLVTFDDKHYSCDDNVLVILRRNEKDVEVYEDTEQKLMEWMAGQNKDFITNPNDVIAYVSPKRTELLNGGTITDSNEAYGSPITNWINEVTINSSSHSAISNSAGITSTSFVDMEIEVDLKINERVELYWINLGNMTGTAIFPPTFPSIGGQKALADVDCDIKLSELPYDNQYHIIGFTCGESDLDLAQNLPNITCKDFISDFITQYNLFSSFKDGIVTFSQQKQQQSNDSYDITSRVVDDNWISKPLPTPRTWEVGYTVDKKDRLLTSDLTTCSSVSSGTNNYGNVEFDNPNANSDRKLSDFTRFSSTKFTSGNITLHDVSSGAGINLPVTTPDPASGIIINKGIEAGTQIPLGTFTDLLLPSIQSLESFNQIRLGDLTYDYNYKARLIYHLGTVNQFTPLDNEYQSLVGSPRADANFILRPNHWFRPTVSQFDHENDILTGISYPSMRYDSTIYDDGLYIRYFENLIQLYNESELASVTMAMRSIDWNRMDGTSLIRFNSQSYRLSQIINYDAKDNTPCVVVMIKEI